MINDIHILEYEIASLSLDNELATLKDCVVTESKVTDRYVTKTVSAVLEKIEERISSIKKLYTKAKKHINDLPDDKGILREKNIEIPDIKSYLELYQKTLNDLNYMKTNAQFIKINKFYLTKKKSIEIRHIKKPISELLSLDFKNYIVKSTKILKTLDDLMETISDSYSDINDIKDELDEVNKKLRSVSDNASDTKLKSDMEAMYKDQKEELEEKWELYQRKYFKIYYKKNELFTKILKDFYKNILIIESSLDKIANL